MASKAVTEIAKKCLPESSDSDDVIATKMKQCLESAEQIASLESVIQTASLEFDNKPVHLVSKLQAEKLQVSGSLSNESLARASQAGIQAMRANWQWVLRVMKCAQIHLQNGAAYQQLFYEFEEAGYWMNSTLSRVHNSFNQNKLQGKHTDSTSIQEEIKEVTDAFLLWQTKVDYLYERAKEVVPVHQRVGALPHERPVTALTDFSNSEVAFIEGETLTLLDTSDRRKWKVRNSQGNESIVPSVIILIPPPCNEALDNVTRLRIQLLYLWTASIKRLGFQLIAFMLTVFRDWTQEEVAQLQQMFPEDSTEVLRMLGFIESALRQHWSDYGNFHELQARMLRLEMIIEESPTGNHSRSEFVMAVITQIHMLGDLLKMYQEFWAFWDMYRSVMELSKQPKYLLVCDKWEQLCYTTTANFVKFWDNGLAGSDDVDGLNLGIMNITSQHEEATTETVITTVQEEQHTFDIQSVLDPRDSTSQLSLQDAIRLGIVDQARTIYTNPVTGATMSMTDAINEGRILMKTISKEKIREEQRSYGIISVRLTREKHPYTVKAVVDPRTKRNLSLAQASAEGIIDMYNKIYKSETGERISLDNAISKGLVTAEYHEGPNNNLEVATKSYAVHGVVDQRKKSKVSFADAVRDGLLDKDTGDYFNNATGEKVGVQEAIMRGFIKARVVTDLSKLDIDPKNHIIHWMHYLIYQRSVKTFAIRVTNDGVLYGNEVRVTVFDSSCQSCNGSNCVQLPNTCQINNLCYQSGDLNPNDNNQICNTDLSTSLWSQVPTVSHDYPNFIGPTLSGPTHEGTMVCAFNTSDTSPTARFKISWYIDGTPHPVPRELNISPGELQAVYSLTDLPRTGMLVCKIRSLYSDRNILSPYQSSNAVDMSIANSATPI